VYSGPVIKETVVVEEAVEGEEEKSRKVKIMSFDIN
jgi:hypothetical protein